MLPSLRAYYAANLCKLRLQNLLQQPGRQEQFSVRLDDLLYDYSKENIDENILEMLGLLFKEKDVTSKIQAMFAGGAVNFSEKRPALHTLCRTGEAEEHLVLNGIDFSQEVLDVRKKIQAFAGLVRSGERTGATGKPFQLLLNIGIGGSLLGLKSTYEGFRACQDVRAKGDKVLGMKFIANVDPADFAFAVEGVDCETVLIIIASKSFTTMETAMNLSLVKKWIVSEYQKRGSTLTEQQIFEKHILVSTANQPAANKAGFPDESIFRFWDWVGGRYSASSSCGVLALSIAFGPEFAESYLAGMRKMDLHFRDEKDFKKNIPVLLGLVDYFHINVQELAVKALIPYAQPLHSFLLHIAQLEMESNGKIRHVDAQGKELNQTGGVIFGDVGSNCQHSFFQLIHQGRVVPVEFLVFINNALDNSSGGHPVSHHQELLFNYFAQVKALTLGRTKEELLAQSPTTDPEVASHASFSGNRPTSSLLFPQLTTAVLGALFSIYENRVVVEGWLSGVNSFDQYGVELGKKLCTGYRELFEHGDIKSEEKKQQLVKDHVTGHAWEFYFEQHKK